MALSLASPGISIKEVDLTRGGINNTTSLSAGIAAPFEKGPVNQVVSINTENELVNIFGKPSKNDFHYEYWYSASNFLSYGGSLKVVRCPGTNLVNSNAGVSTASASVVVNNFEEYQASTPTSYYWAARNPGSWADGVKVCIIDNFADQTISGISTSNIAVGYAVTQSLSGTIAGIGTTLSASGYLKGIVSGVEGSKIHVKVLSTVSSGNTETSVEYTEGGVYSFVTGSTIYFNGAGAVGVGSTVIGVTRAGLSTYSATSIGAETALDLLNVDSTVFVDNQGGAVVSNSQTTIYVNSSVGITSAKFLLIDNEIMDVTSVGVSNNITVTRGQYGTVAVEHNDGATIKILSLYSGNTTTSSGISSTTTNIPVTGIGSVSSGDYLVNPSSGEIMVVTSVTSSSSASPTTIDDWYNTQNILDASRGDSSTLPWRSVAPKPTTNQYVTSRGGANDALHVVVIDSKKANNISGTPETILEKFVNLSKATDTTVSPSENVYYKDYLALNSRYVYAGKSLGFSNETDSYWGIDPVASKFSSGNTPQSETLGVWGVECQNVSFNSIGNKSFTLSGGKDYSGDNSIGGFDVSLSDITTAYNKLANESEVSLNFLLQGSASLGKTNEQAKANALISIAESRKDCIAFISPYREAVVDVPSADEQLTNVLSFFSPITSSSYAVFDSGYQYVFDRFNNQFVYIPCSADIAGLCVRTDINEFPWYSPAGRTRGSLRFPLKLAFNPNQIARDRLYSQRINPIISSPGAGFILFGDKTALSYSSAFDRINVRRLFITIQQAIKNAADAQLFEFNDSTTRANFINIVEPYLRDVQIKRGITDFLLICDESNNTPDVIDRNEFIADIYIKPARAINFIGLTFVATRTGVSFETVVGTV